MSLDNARYMKKKITAGDLQIDPLQNHLIVNYEVEATILGDFGEPLRKETKASQKRIKIKKIDENSNIPVLAQEIVEKCKYIQPAKLELVEQLLYELQRRKLHNDYVVHDEEKELEEHMRRQRKHMQQHPHAAPEQPVQQVPRQPIEEAFLDQLDAYIETFYEDDIKAKIHGTMMVLQLVRNPDNLQELVQNETLLGALSRLLLEDGKKSVDLVINIVFIFYSFSNFSDFHQYISQYKVGAQILKLVESEISRHELWIKDYEKTRNQTEDDKDAIEDKKRKLRIGIKKQEKLLSVCLHVLLNLAEDLNIERKMQKKKIVAQLVKLLERRDPDLLILTVTFLKKLSIFKENKDEMVQLGITEKVLTLIPHENEVLLNVLLRLAVNLAFDPEFRRELIDDNHIPKLIALLKSPAHRKTVLQLLYLISTESKFRSMFAYADAIPLVMRFVIEYPEAQLISKAPDPALYGEYGEYGEFVGEVPPEGLPDTRIGKELIALAINLAAHERSAELMIEKKGLYHLMRRVFQTGDPVLMKVLRNIAVHEKLKPEFLPYIHDLLQMMKGTENMDLLVEVIATLANVMDSPAVTMETTDLNLFQILDEYELLMFLHRFFVHGIAEDDVVLEVIMLLGAFAVDPACAAEIANSRLLGVFYDIFTEKQDDEIVLQLVFVIYRLLLHEETYPILLSHTQLISFLIDLLQDNNEEVRRLVGDVLQIVAEADEEWAVRICERKYHLHNQQWLEKFDEDEADEADLYQQDRPLYMGEDGQLYDAHGAHIMLADDDDLEMDGVDWGGDDPTEQMHPYPHGGIEDSMLHEPHLGEHGLDPHQGYLQPHPDIISDEMHPDMYPQ